MHLPAAAMLACASAVYSSAGDATSMVKHMNVSFKVNKAASILLQRMMHDSAMTAAAGVLAGIDTAGCLAAGLKRP